MEQELYNHEFNKMFVRYSNAAAPGNLEIELDMYKKLFSFLLSGDSYVFIINFHKLQFERVGKEVEDVLGYTPNEFTISFMNSILHPEDYPWFLTFGKRIIEFLSQLPLDKLMKYKMRYDFRLRKKNGDYARILYQGILVEHDNDGKFSRALSVHSDITYLKHEGKPVLSFIGLEGEPSYVDVGGENVFIESREELTAREKQILKLLMEGKLSKQISSILNISKQTVDTHRKNMLHKKHLTNTGELIGKALTYGWI